MRDISGSQKSASQFLKDLHSDTGTDFPMLNIHGANYWGQILVPFSYFIVYVINIIASFFNILKTLF